MQNEKKRALITGIGGQDGSYLADILLEKGYEVHGLHRHSSVDNLARIAHVRDRVVLHVGDVTDPTSVLPVVEEVSPHEIYHEADQDSVGDSKMAPGYQIDVTVKGVINVLEAAANLIKPRIFVPLSATMFEGATAPQWEGSAVRPMSVYACAKAAAWKLCRYYRNQRGLFVACGILFNHDSPRRGRHYLLQRIARGEQLWGNVDTLVDIGYAREYMEAAWQMLQLAEPVEVCMGTGKAYMISNLVAGTRSYTCYGLGNSLIADCGKAERLLGWQPKHDAFSTLQMIKESLR